ncbi:COBRA [Macleaya cordata]|uniref:AP-2 complex subunit sigma n=2 Tax=Magnoliopsida TaxID=3398 RepID=A0A200Q366_MACCD|nr:COBRA [Macleaya cordata]
MIRFILLQNRQGKTRLAKYYVPLEESEKHKVEYEVHRLVVNRDPKFTNFVEFRTNKVIYRRYAGLFFSMCVDITDNELAYLECIHLFVEILDHFFSNVCELDLVFNFHKVYLILDEFILAGELQETSKKVTSLSSNFRNSVGLSTSILWFFFLDAPFMSEGFRRSIQVMRSRARVTIQNYYQYRHVEKPGWTLGWTWARNEIIWSMAGAFATQQGNCSSFKDQMIPHSCKKDPVIADLMPDAKAENRSENCCNGGLLSAWAIDPPKSFSSFEIVVGNLERNSSGYLPQNLTFKAPGPGYTCGSFADYEPTVYQDIDGRREMQGQSQLNALNLMPWMGSHPTFRLSCAGIELTSHPPVVFHSPHFTILLSLHALSAAVHADLLVTIPLPYA